VRLLARHGATPNGPRTGVTDNPLLGLGRSGHAGGVLTVVARARCLKTVAGLASARLDDRDVARSEARARS
jgi:hypothetical protein